MPNEPPKGKAPEPIRLKNGGDCDHKFVHLNTICNYEYAGYKNSYFSRIDTFFCQKCLQYKEKKFQSSGEKYPEWWIEKK